MGKCVFNPKWTESFPWVIKHEDKFKAFCKVCKKPIDLGKMGEGALCSHEKSDKHKQFQRTDSSQQSMQQFTIPPPPTSAAAACSGPACSTVQPSSSVIPNYFSNNDVLKAEILWTIQTCEP